METSSKSCPICRLINPASAQVCDCGYTFTPGMQDPNRVRSLLEKKARILISAGASSLALGLAMTLLITLAASSVGIYVLFYGLILGGLGSLAKGIGTKIRIRKMGL
jgi:hypothetical protein